MESVKLRNLHKAFGDYTALEQLNLSIADGEFMMLLGPSGCGKSTTMRLIAGLEAPTSGEILIGDRRVNDVPARDRDLAMVFQNYALYPHMTVAENIGYPLKIAKLPKAERAKRVQSAAAKIEMEQLQARRPGELSGGEQQRVALARAIMRRPQLSLMDEPLSNLDAKLRTVMRAELRHHVRVGDMLIAAKVGPDGGREMDSAVSLTFDQAKLHISTARLVKGAAEMAFSFATAATTLLPLDQAQVFFGGIFSDPKLSHASGTPGPEIWAYDLDSGTGGLWYDQPLNPLPPTCQGCPMASPLTPTATLWSDATSPHACYGFHPMAQAVTF